MKCQVYSALISISNDYSIEMYLKTENDYNSNPIAFFDNIKQRTLQYLLLIDNK